MRILIIAIVGILFQASTTNAFWDDFVDWWEDAWDSLTGNDETADNGSDNYSDKCTPSDSCWPSADEWRQLNRDLNGQLLTNVKPYTSPCFEDIESSLC